MSIFSFETHFKYTRDGLYPSYSMTKIVPEKKWFTLPNMDQIIAIDYNKLVVELTKLKTDVLETFFLVRGHPPHNYHFHIMFIGLLPNHFAYVFLKDECLLPPLCAKWKLYKKDAVES